jgi:hypothetical protein
VVGSAGEPGLEGGRGLGEAALLQQREAEDRAAVRIAAETVVLALGAKSQNSLLQELEGKVPEIYSIGDCVSPRKMIEAIQSL